MPTPTPLDARRLYRQIADQLGQLIAGGAYPVGTRLPAERELALQFGVSRPSVREALIALEVEGAVEVRGGSGVFVLPASSAPRRSAVPAPGPFDVIRARWIVESEAAALAATHATPAQLQRLHDALSDMRSAPSHNAAALDADHRFHLGIAEASHNSALVMVTQQLWDARRGPLYMQLESHFVGAQIWREAVTEHGEILQGIASRDARAARAAMRKHMKNAEVRFASGWRPQG
ncbi:MAG: FadR/GntR family transcriptional regulator [Burkholderiales bacterium]|nr:FadR/GntR family transcriptional regulator [Burkholderiales bacterium]